ncbi:hypothetical protein JVT61DRAFT_4570 [Boletus reticuloceps]|uniref:F-box domain-containing protein n=1 Tax=Boletus reticuloceps TaxID=495285 RepID=A0A8I2YMW4_9AGAM|nr:hypothetical protein JVT61DRAFT_4570 [Boletus reticuloceps]
MESQRILPPEVISHILSFLSPQEVVWLRVVSKQFRDISYDRAIWTTLYRNAPLPRPPGPFPSQTVQFLERTLVQSERLAHSWTTQPMEEISSVGIRPHGALDFYAIVYGRWLIGCERYSKVKIVAYDLEAGSHPYQVLWEHYMHYSCDACPVVSSSGPLVHVLFTADSSSWKLLEFRVNGNSFHHTFTLDIPSAQLELEASVMIYGGHSPFSYIKSFSSREKIIFNVETRSFYKFPPFESELANTDQPSSHVVLTNTHVISFFPHTRTGFDRASSTLVRAFTAPADSQLHNGTGILRLSHEGVIPNCNVYNNADLIRNSIVDAESGTINIRLLHQTFNGKAMQNLHMSCIDLMLPKHSSTDIILPMTIDLHDITDVHVPRNSYFTGSHECSIDFSDDGHVRGFYHFFAPRGILGRLSHSIMQFTIDASRDRCVADLGPILTPRWHQVGDLSDAMRIFFDGVRGRICYDRRYIRGANTGIYEAALVVNIK